jgi:hypothetical protein
MGGICSTAKNRRLSLPSIGDVYASADRLTNGFSKKMENLQAAVALHFAHYNVARLHKTLRVTPAMAAGVTNRVWSLEELVERTSN